MHCAWRHVVVSMDDFVCSVFLFSDGSRSGQVLQHLMCARICASPLSNQARLCHGGPNHWLSQHDRCRPESPRGLGGASGH
eukprot:6940024-Pyramimonas_sp.AAC.1